MAKDYQTLLLEEIRDQNKAILEGINGLPTRAEFNDLRADVSELKDDMKSVKAAVKDLSRDLEAHKNDARLHPVSNFSGGLSV